MRRRWCLVLLDNVCRKKARHRSQRNHFRNRDNAACQRSAAASKEEVVVVVVLTSWVVW